MRVIPLSALICLFSSALAAAPISAEPISFNRDIRPILSDNCFACHGPDEKTRKARLRLDLEEGAFARHDDYAIILAGNSAESELYARIAASDPGDRMPPPDFGKQLSSEQVDLLRRWIDQGAQWEGHWAFIPPERPALPEVKREDWPRNGLDHFILGKLESEGLAPSPEADPARLIRRVTLDLTGLPPTLEEVDAFLADPSPRAYERAVDRLLASPHYGERMALHWLDLARYADTHGYHLDSGRDMWKWREWVIEAFNENKPFDQFTVEQIAGDLLPNPTLSQKVATGFNRNNMINFEGGAIPEEYLNHYIVDRVHTTSTVFLGLTMTCAQCHDHKYDPISQKEYYQFYAYFNAVPERGLDGNRGNAAPFIHVPTPAQQLELDQLEAALGHQEQLLQAALPEIDAAQLAWEQQQSSEPPDWILLDPARHHSAGGATLTKLDDGSFLATGTNPDKDTYEFTARVPHSQITAVRLETLTHESLPGNGPGRAHNSNFVLDEFELEIAPLDASAPARKVQFASASAEFSQSNFPVGNAIDGKPNTGWAVDGPNRRLPNTAWFICAEPAGFPEGTELRFRLHFGSSYPRHGIGRPRLSITTDPAILQNAFPSPELQAIIALPKEQRTDSQAGALRKYYRENVSTRRRELDSDLASLRKSLDEFKNSIPTTMVMRQMEKPRDTFLLIRGMYDQHGEKVAPGVPAVLPPLPDDAPPNRLALAQWLVDPGHPLMARVTVNRFWAMLMGAGIVRTVEDFGSQAEWPSHPELLDWLATEFVSNGWDVKAFLKMLVTSATYRQSSVLDPALAEFDPRNTLLARGPRFRLPAEIIRDNALSISGLLVDAIGGPSVLPYQPEGLWEELSSRQDSGNWSAQTYVQSRGPDLYRRGLYTFWKRTSPPPSLQAFDAPDRETCVVQRERTSTPLQALVLMNDPTYVEAARKLAERIMTAPNDPSDRIAFAFRLATARPPSQAESAILLDLFHKQLARFQAKPSDALDLLSVGDSARDKSLDPIELAAWTSVANMILNLDETITKL